MTNDLFPSLAPRLESIRSGGCCNAPRNRANYTERRFVTWTDFNGRVNFPFADQLLPFWKGIWIHPGWHLRWSRFQWKKGHKTNGANEGSGRLLRTGSLARRT